MSSTGRDSGVVGVDNLKTLHHTVYKVFGVDLHVVSRCGLAVRRLPGKQKALGSIRFGSPFSSKIVVYGHCLVTLPTQLMKH